MFKNIYYNTKTSTIHLWEQIRGENLYSAIYWVPYAFVEDKDGDYKTIEGRGATKLTFDNYSKYWVSTKDKSNLLENKIRPEIQFLAERYHGIEDDSIEAPKLRIYYIDIEVHKDHGFPTMEAEDPITLVSIYDNIDQHTTTFGLHPYTGKYKGKEWFTYVHCPDERSLMISFFNHIKANPCDVISGWYIYDFDLPYLITRSKVLFGENNSVYRKLSPISIVRLWKEGEESALKIDIAGVSILDYIDIYKWYSPHKLERHTLDFVAKFELDVGKVDYSVYGSLRELYNKNWNLYVEYNATDAYRVGQLGKKLGYIRLVQALSLLCKAPMKNYYAMTQLIEGLLLTYFRRNGLCAPHFWGGTQETFEAAYVKEPKKGLFDWIIDLDIESSYPAHIITLNMSPETYYGRILGMEETEIIECVTNRNFTREFSLSRGFEISRMVRDKLVLFNKALERRLFSIAPCGSIFYNTKVGILPSVERQVFGKRSDIKGKMIRLKKSLPDLRGKDLERITERSEQLHSLQFALKIILNAMFGVTSVPYSRYFNQNIAEAITSCGRQTIRSGEKFANEILNHPNDDLKVILQEMKEKIEGVL